MSVAIKLSKCLLAVCDFIKLPKIIQSYFIYLFIYFLLFSLQRIEHVKTPTIGYLYGLVQNNAILVLGFSLNESIEKHLPIGFKDLGSIQWSNDGNFNQPGVCEVSLNLTINFLSTTKFFNSQFQDNDVVQLKFSLQSSNNQLVVASKNKSGEWETVQYAELTEDELRKEWICIRTEFHLSYSVDDASKYRERLLQLLQSTREKTCETHKPILKVSGTEIVLKKEKVLVGIGKNAKISAAVQQTKGEQNSSNPNQFETLNIVLESGEDESIVDGINSAFSSKFHPNQNTNTILVLAIDKI